MHASYHKNFKKSYKKLSANLKDRANQRIKLFLEQSFHPTLNNHALTGKYLGYRSINITGVFRAPFEILEGEITHFIAVDTHSNLYK